MVNGNEVDRDPNLNACACSERYYSSADRHCLSFRSIISPAVFRCHLTYQCFCIRNAGIYNFSIGFRSNG